MNFREAAQRAFVILKNSFRSGVIRSQELSRAEKDAVGLGQSLIQPHPKMSNQPSGNAKEVSLNTTNNPIAAEETAKRPENAPALSAKHQKENISKPKNISTPKPTLGV